jgi:DNA processing protein
VTHGEHVLEVVGDVGTHLVTPPRAPARPRDRLPPRDARVLDAVPFASPAPVVSIASTAGMALLDVQSALRRLDRDGLVELCAQGWRLTPAARE